jgi:hypothetical protein
MREKIPAAKPQILPASTTPQINWRLGAFVSNMPKYGLLPINATTIKPLASTPSNTSFCHLKEAPRPTSSIAKITPAKGALNAAARPPAAPVAINSEVCT